MDGVGFILKGVARHLEARDVVESLRGRRPEPIQSHAVEVEGRLFPIKQAFSLATGLDRLDFTTAQARAVLQRLGFHVVRADRGEPLAPGDNPALITSPSLLERRAPRQTKGRPTKGGRSSMEPSLYWVHVNHPTSKARLHADSGCAHVRKAAARVAAGEPYGSTRGDSNGCWKSFDSLAAAESYQEGTRKKTRDRCSLGPCRALLGERQDHSDMADRAPKPSAFEVRFELLRWLDRAERQGLGSLDVRAGDLHRALGAYPGRDHRMPICCQVMRSAMREGDQIIAAPPAGDGATLTIRYRLPRK